MAEIAPAPPLHRLILRGEVAEAAGPAFGVPLPRTPCRAQAAGDRAALWLGPDEWLLLAPDDAGPALRTALATIPHSLVDVSDGFAALRLRGPDAAELLAAGCPLDLHERSFPTGMATRTILERAGITLWRMRPDEWHLEVGRSYFAYVVAFLTEAEKG